MSASTDRTSPPWPGSKCPQSPGPPHQAPHHPALNKEPRNQAQHVWSGQKYAGYCNMMSSKIIPVIQSFQSKLRLFESLKHTGIGSWAEVVTLLLVHSPAGEFIWCPDPFYDIWPGHSGSGCGYCQPGDNVLPMLPRSLRRHQRERESLAMASASETIVWQHRAQLGHLIPRKLGQKSPRRNLNSYTPATCSRDCRKSCILIYFLKLNSILLGTWAVILRCGSLLTVTAGQSWPPVARTLWTVDNMIYEGVYTQCDEIRTKWWVHSPQETVNNY